MLINYGTMLDDKEYTSGDKNKFYNDQIQSYKFLDLLINTESISYNDPVLTEVERIIIIRDLTKSAYNHFGPLDEIESDDSKSSTSQSQKKIVEIKEKNLSCFDSILIILGCKKIIDCKI